MSYVIKMQCVLCHRDYLPSNEMMTCPACGDKGIIDIQYDYQALKKVLTKTYFKNNHDYSIWRYLPLLSVAPNLTAHTLRVGWTPLYHSNALAKLVHVKALFIKDEGINPTGSLKDRASVIAVMKAIEQGKTTVACSSTGNAATSLAGNAARMGLKSVIFVPKRVPSGKLTQLLAYGAKVIRVNGDYKDAFDLSKAAIDHYGWYNRNAAVNPHLVEGKKTVALEIAEQHQFKVTDWVVVSVGDGCTIAGVYKGFYDLYQLGLIDSIPKLLGVQSQGCQPIYEAFIHNQPIKDGAEDTIADSIAVGMPRNSTKALFAVKQSQGAMISVSDQNIIKCIPLLGKTEGIFAEPAAAASLAGLMQAVHASLIKPNETVTIIVTGNGLKDIKNATSAVGQPIDLNPDLESFIKHMKQEVEETK